MVLTRHEQGRSHGGRGTPRPRKSRGLFGDIWPRYDNVITALADAIWIQSRSCVSAGGVPESLIGNDAFQEADNIGLESSLYQVHFLGEGCERPGNDDQRKPSILRRPDDRGRCWWTSKDVSMAKAEFTYPSSVAIRGYNPTYEGNKWQIKRLLKPS